MDFRDPISYRDSICIGISVVGNLLLCFTSLYTITSFGNLESDIVGSQEFCEQTNKLLYLSTCARLILVFVSLVGHNVVAFCVSTFALIVHLLKYFNSTYPYNPDTIRETHVLSFERSIKAYTLVTDGFLFFWNLTMFAFSN